MSDNAVPQTEGALAAIEQARARWLAASECASAAAAQMWQAGGYGCPDALLEDQHRRDAARLDAERLFQEYQDLDRRWVQQQMLRLQRSQQLATWASFSVAVAVGIATIAGIIAQIVK